jgi:hypothetical protein
MKLHNNTNGANKMSEINKFRTAKFHAIPQRMPLYNSDGSDSEHYIDILGIKSPVMRKKKQELIREAAKNIKEGEWNEEIAEKFSNDLLSCAITGWSFEEEPTPEFVKEFLMDAPDIRDAIDSFCSEDKNYFEKK